GSRVGPNLQLSPASETSGVRVVTLSEPDVIPEDAASRPDAISAEAEVDASSMVNLGELPHKNAPADLMLASDALESGASRTHFDKGDAARGDSAEALVEPLQDSGVSGLQVDADSASGPSSEQSGLDLTILSGGSSEGSSILPERPRRRPVPDEKPAR